MWITFKAVRTGSNFAEAFPGHRLPAEYEFAMHKSMSEDKSITVKGLQQDIEVTAVKDAGASVIEKYSSGEYDPFFAAEEVFRAMIARLAHQPTQ